MILLRLALGCLGTIGVYVAGVGVGDKERYLEQLQSDASAPCVVNHTWPRRPTQNGKTTIAFFFGGVLLLVIALLIQ